MHGRVLASLALLLALAVTVGAHDCPRDVKERVNLKGTAMADVVVSSTAVLVADANANRCALTIRNTTANDMRCASFNQGTPTAAAGLLIAGDEIYAMTTEGKEAWYCIRTGASDAAAMVIEAVP